MTKIQAIEIIKSNYPSREKYSILCESLDIVLDIMNGNASKYSQKDKYNAIEAIKGNYPSNYSDLCTALDIAIEALNKQYITEQFLNHIKVDCNSAEINAYGECLGFSYDNDDEPIEVCKNCFRHIGYGEE